MKLSIKLAVSVAVIVMLLSGCGKIGAPAQPTTEPTVPVEQIAMIVTEESIAELEQNYPSLKEADLSGSTCYAEIESYIARNPQVQVTYTVSLGQKTVVSPDVTSLTLGPEEYDFLSLRSNLKYLHNLRSVYLENSMLLPDAVRDLQIANPNVQITYSVNLGDITCAGESEELDLSAVNPEEILSQAEMLSLLPNLESIQLMTADGTSPFSLEQAAELQKAVPDVLLRYTFRLFDQQISTTDEEVTYSNKNIGTQPGAADTLRTALSIMRGCKRFVLDNCRFDNDVLAQIRDECRGTTKLVWRVWFGKGGCTTDREVVRHVYDLYDSNSKNLIYCEGAEFADFGHNEILKSCEFVSGMKNLRAIILSGSMISDLTPFVHCEKLEFLEIAYCGYVEDISPLAYCKNLKRLNIAYTKVSDLSALDDLDLEVLVIARSKVPQEEWERFEALHPDCIVQHTGDAKEDQPYGYPWRYEQNGDPNSYYALLKEKFRYPNPSNTLY